MSAIFWVDLETTGLDPRNDQILEVAVKLTDNDLNSVLSFHGVAKPAIMPPMDLSVSDMHTQSGLLTEVEDGLPIGVIEEKLARLLDNLAFETKPVVAGSTIRFDRGFIETWMPELNSRLHYRSIDVSTLRELADRWGYPVPEKREVHRAMADIEESIWNLKFYRENMLK